MVRHYPPAPDVPFWGLENTQGQRLSHAGISAISPWRPQEGGVQEGGGQWLIRPLPQDPNHPGKNISLHLRHDSLSPSNQMQMS